MNRNHTIALILCCLSITTQSHATNGINLIGYGAESTLMGGADTAVARDTSALNTNPAGLAQIKGKMFDAYGSLLRTTDLSHQDARNDQHADNRYVMLAGGGYAQQLENSPCTAGIGFFTQGGAGAVFKHINTPFGTDDEMSSLFGIAKITPGIGCQVTDNLSIGGSISMIYASIEQKFFYHTPPTSNFAGFKNEGADTLRFGFKLGAQYKLNEQWTLGASYTEKTELPLTGGTAKFNYGAAGVVKYDNLSIKGFALPREVAIGAAFKPNPDLLLSAKINWLNWADAINDVTTTWSDTTSAFAPASVVNVSQQDWRNQIVYALGAAYTYDDKTTLYAGYNYGKNPVPRNNSSALLAAILEEHVTLGFARKLDETWKITSGIEFLLPKKVTYDSAIFGNNTEVRNEGFFLHLMLSKQW
ncbi:aromatic hydrocarbon degradation protein [Methylotenera oryzisoli]|uniref:Aromatic hydrocarbon degradation protein n=1 Tax=Methylotenera oryzisoli TaxID=2080758 RepID=A0A4Y9VS21_9PROT|nr:outer membrane protein transport protein [Methylotenera oryzisoli]TFW71157.1 aromatic hydrocarbon degradation protein [Methylotenera oryzisoli]